MQQAIYEKTCWELDWLKCLLSFFFFNLDSFDAISLGERNRNGIEGKVLPAGIEPDSLSYTFRFFASSSIGSDVK